MYICGFFEKNFCGKKSGKSELCSLIFCTMESLKNVKSFRLAREYVKDGLKF